MRKLNSIDYVLATEDLKPFLESLEFHGRWVDLEIGMAPIQRTYFDSFAWGLYNNGLLLFKEDQTLHLISRKKTHRSLAAPVKRDPIWPANLPLPLMVKRVAPLCKFRRLFPKAECQVNTQRLALQDELEKTILRVELRRFSVSGSKSEFHQLRLLPLMGYDEVFAACTQELETTGHQPLEEDLGFSFFPGLGLDTRPHKTRLKIQIQKDTSIQAALSSQLRLLAEDVEHHRQGVIEDFDTEFLHQLRIAVRRSRSLLSYFRKDLSSTEVQFASELLRSWGQKTNPLRDLDVLLLDEPTYRQLLPDTHQPALDAFFKQLKGRRQRAKRNLATYLSSPTFRLEYQRLGQAIQHMNLAPLSWEKLPLKTALYERLRRRLKKLRALLKRCIAGVPEEELHRLRIQIKKLRYILTSFESLFPKDTFQEALQQLKRCQNVLGERHDMEWQRDTLLATINSSPDSRLPMDTVKAIAMLAGVIHARHAHQWPDVQQGLRNLESVSFKALLNSLKI